ncbi:MAG: D-glycerate dehydrogenase [Acidobacteriota bacterium]|nr:MAG: D-glycerate dehydrogenase [Acidobacteriota bacterium]
MSFRIFATCNIGEDALDRVRELGYDLEVFAEQEPPGKALILERVRGGIDGLITTLRDPIDREVFEAGRGTLRVVAQDAVGFDNIDRQAANDCGIPFTNTADVLTHATAEFAFFLLGAVSRKLYPSERIVRENRWSTWHPFLPILGDEVTGKTVAVIGTGRIGRAFAVKCTGFQMDILCCDGVEDRTFVSGLQELLDTQSSLGLSRRRCSASQVSFEEALERADYVSLHVPLLPETYHLIDAGALRRMKQSAYLINTSRGPVVDEQALCQALKERWIAGAALDVFEREPLPEDSPLRDPELTDRLRMFHHFASATRETRLSPDPEIGMAGRCVQGLIDVLEGNYGGDLRQMPYVVNKEAF